MGKVWCMCREYTTTSPQGALHDVLPHSPPYGAKAPPGGVEDKLAPMGLCNAICQDVPIVMSVAELQV